MASVARPPHRVLRYEDRLNADPDWALTEGSRYFMGEGEVRATLNHITRRLNEIGVPYAVVGGLALTHHGHRRFTEDVDILVTAEGLKTIHERLVGLGFVPPFTGSRHLRDTSTGVKIEFLVTGDYPGDGKPKSISFPDPERVSVVANGVRYLDRTTLVQLKLASGLSAPHRGKDLIDVQELIRAARLPRELADRLHPDVRAKYLELWDQVPRRFVRIVPTSALDSPEVVAMLADGVTRDPAAAVRDGYAYLTTSDPAVASKHGMKDEADLWDDGPAPDGPDHV